MQRRGFFTTIVSGLAAAFSSPKELLPMSELEKRELYKRYYNHMPLEEYNRISLHEHVSLARLREVGSHG